MPDPEKVHQAAERLAQARKRLVDTVNRVPDEGTEVAGSVRQDILDALDEVRRAEGAFHGLAWTHRD